MEAETTQVNHDETIRALARHEAKVEALTDSMRDLRKAIEELIDRVDADIDTLRAKSESFAVVASNVDDLKRRATILETKLEALALDNAKLEQRLETAIIERTQIATKLESLTARVYMISGAAATVAWVAGKLFK